MRVQAVHQMLGTSEEAVDLTFSIIGTATGILGTLLGGAWLDAAGNDIQHANVLCTICSAISTVTAVLSFWAATSLASFVVYFTIASTASSVLVAPSSALPPFTLYFTRSCCTSLLLSVLQSFAAVLHSSMLHFIRASCCTSLQLSVLQAFMAVLHTSLLCFPLCSAPSYCTFRK